MLYHNYAFNFRYEKCGVHGWKDREKREEMSEERALYLIVRNKDGEPVAFVHFRFDMEYDEEVLYWYVELVIFCLFNGFILWCFIIKYFFFFCLKV
jgi:hypothetical protein